MLYHTTCLVMHIERVKRVFPEPSNNANEKLEIRGVLVQVHGGAPRKLAIRNVLSASNPANTFQVS